VSPFEYTTFWITVFVYTLGAALALTGLIFNRERVLAAAGIACGAGFLVHCVAIGARIVHTGHIPVASRYENILTGAAVVMLFNLIAILRRRSLAPTLVFAAPFTLLMLGYALLNQPRFTTMSPVLDNLWMFVHVFFAWMAYGSYSVAAAVGVVYLLRGRKRFREASPEQIPALFQRLPALGVLDELMYRFVSYWSWDPVETWSLLSGLLYGLWIHLRLALRWHGARMAWLAVGTLVTVLFAFWGTNLLGSTSHSLDDLTLRAAPEEGTD
jgi:ABC-type transport system involved in cytochrome c biogenesis permease subunit